MKICIKCGIEKPYFDFHKLTSSKDGYRNKCKMCRKEDELKYRDKNLVYQKQWKSENKEHCKSYGDNWKKENREHIQKYKINYNRERYKKDIKYRLLVRVKRRIWDSLNGIKKCDTAIKLLGCTIAEYMNWLEQFFEEGMNWNNYGVGKNCWNIDHIIPCSKFDLTIPNKQRQCFYYKNTQPLWCVENSRKGDKIL